MKSVAFHTLGCKLNFSESAALGRMMEAEGFEKRPFEEPADVYVINTCSVTDNADKECRQLVRRIQRRAPESLVVITGCYAQLKPQEIAGIEGVDLVLGAAEKFNLGQHIRSLAKGDSTRICSCDIEEVNGFTATYSTDDRTRVFLKVQDGCDYNCSFCTIPLARGHSRSDSISNVLENIKTLKAAGTREIVLTGINLGDFGKGQTGGKKADTDFLQLLRAIEETEGVERYRISSIEPNLLNDEIIELVASSRKFMPHFHIPLQSGSNPVLGLMRRRYRKELYRERVEKIKALMPDCCIGVDVIVGFPGETEAYFRETADFLQELDISYLHVFTYSERDNTLAATMEAVVPPAERHRRNKVLRHLSYRKMQLFTASHAGQTRPVLFENNRKKDGMMVGYTDNYIQVKTPYSEALANQIIDWQL